MQSPLLSCGARAALIVLFPLGAAIGQGVAPTSPRAPATPVTTGGGCNPPLPLSGQKVVWSPVLNPVRICQSATLPAGAEVELAPGTQLEVLSGATFTVEGLLHGAGSATSRVRLSGAGKVLVKGRATLEHADVDLDLDSYTRSTIELRDAVVATGSDLSSFARDALLSLEAVTIQSGAPHFFGQLALRDVALLDAAPSVQWGGYFLADGVVVHGAPLTVSVDHQPKLLEDVDVLSPGAAPALTVTGGGISPGSNALVEGTCDLQGGSVPLRLVIGGLHPESVLPLAGNQRNAIDIGGAGAGSGVCDWPNLGLPYYASDDVVVQGRPRVGPGAVFELEPSAGLEIDNNFWSDSAVFRGTPAQPLIVRPASPGSAPHTGVALLNATALHVDVEGASISSVSGNNEILECRVHDAPLGIYADASAFVTVRGCTLEFNQTGIEDDLTGFKVLDMAGHQRPNVLENNVMAAVNHSHPSSGQTGPFPAQMNWWGHASGPQSQWINPGGLGDPIGFGVEASPWRSTEPDLSDTPPLVTLEWPFLLAEPGDTVYVRWSVEDDGQIAAQRILMDVSGGGAFQWVALQSGLPADQRGAFVEVPFIGATSDARSTLLRVEATDDAGNVGKSDVTLQVPVLHRPDGSAQFTIDTSAGFLPGTEVDPCYTAANLAGPRQVHLVLDTEENTLVWGPSGFGFCTIGGLRLPRVSTDRARFVLFADGVGNDNDWYFSEPFEIRPLDTFPDRPPQISLLTPADGARFSGGQTVPLSWQANDDEGLREFRVQVSLNDGRTWSGVATAPGSDRAFDWELPEVSQTIDPVRVRVVAVDHRFQTTTHGDERTLVFEPGLPLTGGGPSDARPTLTGR